MTARGNRAGKKAGRRARTFSSLSEGNQNQGDVRLPPHGALTLRPRLAVNVRQPLADRPLCGQTQGVLKVVFHWTKQKLPWLA